MVIHYCAIFCLGIAFEILFLIFGFKHKAKSDKSFFAITLLAIAVILAHALNMSFLFLGNEYAIFSKIALSFYVALNTCLIGSFSLKKISTFDEQSKYNIIIKFIVIMLLFICCILIFYNVFSELFFTYSILYLAPFNGNEKSIPALMVWNIGPMFNMLIFFWVLLVAIYGFLAIIRISIRGIINSVRDFLILGIFLIQCVFFISFIRRTEIILFQSTLFAFASPFLYYLLIYKMKPLFIKKSIRSKLYEESNTVLVIFNADDLLTDFNDTAKNFFGFSRKDIYKLSINDFIKEYVPLGNVPSDSLSVEQIYIKKKNEDNAICQLDFHRLKSFNQFTTCSFFVIRDISSIFQNFAEIQQSSMTDRITGLLAQHVLIKKIREINIFRRFPYSAASCSIHIKNHKPDVNENFALVKIAECIKARIRGSDFAAFENGNIVLLFPAEYNIAKNVMERIVSAIEDDPYLKEDVTFQYGLTTRESPDEDIQQTINRAHAIMFKNKIETSINGL